MRVLILEDRPADAELMLHALRQSGCAPDSLLVDGAEEYRRALAFEFDVILADYELPQYDGLQALLDLQSSGRDIPFIVVSGVISEEIAVECIKRGAADYLLKDRLARLGEAVRRAIEERLLRDEKRRAETALRESEERFRRLAENEEAIIFRYSPAPARKFEYVSPASTTVTGYPPADYYAAPDLALRLVHPMDRPTLRRLLEGEHCRKPVTLRCRRSDGTCVWLELRAVSVRDSAGRLVAVEGIARDVTDWKLAELALRERTEMLGAVVEASPLAIYVLDTEGRVRSWNPAAERTFGWRAVEVMGWPNPGVPPEFQEAVLRRRSRVLAGEGHSGLEEQRIRKDGSRLDVSLSGALLHDAAGAIAGIVVIAEDITDRKQTEAERERLLDQVGKLEAQREIDRLKGDFVNTVSHEFRTPLSALLGFTELILQRKVPEAQQREWLTIMNTEAKRLAKLVDEVLDVSRLEEGRIEVRLQPTRLQDTVRQVASVLQTQSPLHRLEPELDDGVPRALADPAKLTQVLTNLVSNAIKYSPNGGTVRISGAISDGSVRLSVADEGLGIPSEELPRLFGRFHRIKGADRQQIRGTGLGLYITKQLVELQGGRIWAESPGRGAGSTFHVELPIAGYAESPRPVAWA